MIFRFALMVMFALFVHKATGHPAPHDLRHQPKNVVLADPLSNKKSRLRKQRPLESSILAAQSKLNSNGIENIFKNLLNFLVATKQSSDPLKLKQIDYPVAYVLVDFDDRDLTWSLDDHRNLMFGNTRSVKEFWEKNLHDHIRVVPVKESYGEQDGMVIIDTKVAKRTKDDLEDYGEEKWIAETFSGPLSEYLDGVALDKDFNGVLTPDELSVVFITAGDGSELGGWAYTNAARNWEITSGGGGIYIDGVKLHGWTPLDEGPLADTDPSINLAILQTAIAHEVGHLWGLSDKYFMESTEKIFENWTTMATNFTWGENSSVLFPNLMLLDKLESGLLEAKETESSGTTKLRSVNESGAPLRVIRESSRVWLDPYKVRSSVLIEHRTGIRGMEPSDNIGLIAVSVESLATSGAFDDPETTYRRGAFIRGSGPRGSHAQGDTIDVEERTDTPGYSPHPSWLANRATIRVKNTSETSTELDFDIEKYAPAGGHIRYDKTGFVGEESILVGDFVCPGWGGDLSGAAEIATRFYNDTRLSQIDGFEVYLNAPSEVTATVYEAIVDGIPVNQLTSQEFEFSGDKGWQRAFFDNPVSFERGDDLVLALKLQSLNGEQFIQCGRTRDLFPVNRDRGSQNFSRPNDRYSFGVNTDYVWAHILLLSG